MGMEIDKINGYSSSKELVEMQRLSSENLKNKEVKEDKKAEKKEDNKANIDTYNKHKVSNSIEEQIKEQKAKIEELKKNLDGLREEYNTTRTKELEARKERYIKELARHQKEISERSLKNLFFGWRAKFLKAREDEAIRRRYRTSYFNFETATDEKKRAERDYDLADIAAFEAIHAHNIADSHYLGGLWVQQDAYWDLAKMQRRLAIAKLRERMFS